MYRSMPGRIRVCQNVYGICQDVYGICQDVYEYARMYTSMPIYHIIYLIHIYIYIYIKKHNWVVHIIFTRILHLCHIHVTFVLHLFYIYFTLLGPKAPKGPWAHSCRSRVRSPALAAVGPRVLWGLGAQTCKQNVKSM